MCRFDALFNHFDRLPIQNLIKSLPKADNDLVYCYIKTKQTPGGSFSVYRNRANNIDYSKVVDVSAEFMNQKVWFGKESHSSKYEAYAEYLEEYQPQISIDPAFPLLVLHLKEVPAIPGFI